MRVVDRELPAGGESNHSLWTKLQAPLVLFAVWILFFFPALFLNRIFYFRDLFFFHYPLRHFWITGLQEGHFPFLNTGLNGGHPILSNPNYAVFYPGNILYVLFPFDMAWNLSLAGHVLWAAFGVYWLARILQCSRLASACGAVVFAFGGPYLSSMTYHNLLVAGSWFPWIAALSLYAWIRGKFWVPLCAVAIALQFLAGEPTIEMITFLIIVPGWIYGLWKSHSRFKQTTKIIVILALASLIIGIQLMPVLQWLPETQRGRGLPFRLSAAFWSFHPARLLEFLAPHFHGNVMGTYAYDFWGEKYSDSGYPYILKVYSGWLPMLLIPLALRQRWGKPAFLILFAGLILSFGHRLPGYEILYTYLPPFRVIRYPEKFLFMVSLGFALITSIALTHNYNKRELLPTITLSALLLLLLGLAVLLFRDSHLTETQRRMQMGSVGQAAAFCILSVGLLYLGALRRYQPYAPWIIPLVLLLDIGAVTWEVPETHPRELTSAKPDILQKFPDLQRYPILHLGEDQVDIYFSGDIDPVHFMHDVVHPLTGLNWGITYGATNDIDRMGWWKSSARQQEIFDKFPGGASMAILQQSGIGNILSLLPLQDSRLREQGVYRGRHALPLYIYGVPQIPLVRTNATNAKLRSEERSPYRVDFYSSAPAGAEVIIGRNAIRGWKAFEDGKPTEIFPTQDGWIRLKASPGNHTYVVYYRPPGLVAGIILSLGGIVLLAITFLFSKRFPGA